MTRVTPAQARSLGIRDCAACKQPFHRMAGKAMQLYCGSCSERADLHRKKLVVRGAAQRSVGREIGAAISVENARGIGFIPPHPELIWTVRIAVPFSYAASKNHIYSMRASGHVAMRQESKDLKELIGVALARAMIGMPIKHNKVWLNILVQKSDHRGDAINVIDLVCDGIKRALPVDDRWYCIKSLDWEIVRQDPMIIIGVGQEDVPDAQVCSYCGQIKPLDQFSSHAGNRLGKSRECRPCMSAARTERKARRSAPEASP